MKTSDIIAVAGAISALIGGLSAWITQWGMRAAARRKAMAEAASVEAGVSSTLFAEWQKIVQDIRSDVDRLRLERDELKKRLEASEAREEELEKKLRQALRDIEDLKAAAERPRPRKLPA